MNDVGDFNRFMFESELEVTVKKMLYQSNKFSRQDLIRIAQPLASIIVAQGFQMVQYTDQSTINTYVSEILLKLSQVEFTQDSYVCVQNPRVGNVGVATTAVLDSVLTEKIKGLIKLGGKPHSNKANTVYAYGRIRKIYVKVRGEFRPV
jgi:hypothetical protein